MTVSPLRICDASGRASFNSAPDVLHAASVSEPENVVAVKHNSDADVATRKLYFH